MKKIIPIAALIILSGASSRAQQPGQQSHVELDQLNVEWASNM
jgi:hypothetical protein